MRRSTLGLLFATLLPALPVRADNLVVNPDFDTDLQGWSNQGSVTYSWDGQDGSPGVGSIHFMGPANNYLGMVKSACIGIQPSQQVDLSVNVKVDTGSASALLMVSNEPGCPSAGTIGTTAVASAGSGWQTLSANNLVLDANAKGVLVFLMANPDAGGNVDAHFDHIQVIPDVVPVTLQSFDVL